MDQSEIYKIANDSGFRVMEFSDHPQYFGSWKITLGKKHHIYQLVSDGRESVLEIQEHVSGAEWKSIKYTSIANLSKEQELQLCSQWLSELHT